MRNLSALILVIYGATCWENWQMAVPQHGVIAVTAPPAAPKEEAAPD